MSDFDYAVIVPAWNEAEFIESCLASVKNAMQQTSYRGQLIVVDNNSSDDTALIAKNQGAEVVFESINQISRARNAGAHAASANYFIFVDADSHLSHELLQQALDALHNENVVGGGAFIAPDRDAVPKVQAGFNLWNRLSRFMSWAAGCFVFCRADAFHAVGGFTLKRYAGEELALSTAIRKWGKPQQLRFLIIEKPPIKTSLRKMDWYSPWQLLRQVMFAMIPGAMNSKRLLKTWYDDSTRRTNKESDEG